MRKVINIIVIVAFLTSCGKENRVTNDFASAVFINASPINAPVGARTPSLHVYADNNIKTASALSFKGNSGYLAMEPGTRNIQLRSSIDFTTNYVEAKNENFAFNNAYSYIIYDTLADLATGKLKILRLNDTLTPPSANFSKVRFLHLAPKAPSVDITLLRTSAVIPDSITIAGNSYVGLSTPTEATIAKLSGFNSIPSGTYMVNVKLAGTSTVVYSAPINVSSNAIYTIYATGTAQSYSLSTGVFRHY